jgi:protein-tyrosine phosphatase
MTRRDYERYDYLIGMDSYNISNMTRIAGGDPEGKIHLCLQFAGSSRNIADPWYTGNFDETYSDLCEGLNGFMKYLETEVL